MVDGRILSSGQPIPLAVAVSDTNYCFPRLSDEAIEGGKATLLCAGRERCLPSYHVERTEFDCLIVELVVEGTGKVRIDGEISELFPGIVFLYGMKSQHDVWSGPERPMTKYFAAFSVTAPLQDITGTQLDFGIRWTRELSAMQVLFDEMIREGRRGGSLHARITAAYLELILLKTAEALPDDRIPNSRSSGGRDVFERALACIEGSFETIGGLEDLSTIVGANPDYICRLFKRFGDETPIQCLTRHKLNHAAELLLSERLSIVEISRMVGYEDPYYFSRVFKKRFGRSPSAFRGSREVEG